MDMKSVLSETTAAPYSGAEVVPLKNRAPRSGSFGVHGRRAITLGALLLGAVVAMVVLNADELTARPLRWDLDWLIGAFVAAFVAFIGLATLIHGMLGLRRAARIARRRAANAYQPWQWDHEWDERETRDDDAMRRARQRIGFGVGLLVILVPMHVIAFGGGDEPLFMTIVVTIVFGLVALLLDLLAVCMLASGINMLIHRAKYGQGVAKFAHFPYRLGEELELRVRAPRSLPRHVPVTATLRCVQERYVTTTTSDGETQTNIQCFELYRERAAAARVATANEGDVLRISFAIPHDAPPTDLASLPARYWEIDLDAATDGVDYAARFLVPVY